MSVHQEHVEKLMEMAVQNYTDDGELAPTLILSDPRDAFIVKMAGSPDLAPNFAQVAGLMVALRRKTELVITIVEAWSKAYSETDPAMDEVRRHGDLARMHEAGDEKVCTVLVVQATDVNDPSQDMAGTYWCDGEDAGKTQWNYEALQGRMPEFMRRSLGLAKTITLPPMMTTTDALAVMMKHGLIEGAIETITWEEDAPPDP